MSFAYFLSFISDTRHCEIEACITHFITGKQASSPYICTEDTAFLHVMVTVRLNFFMFNIPDFGSFWLYHLGH
jgi:hypothetical protein